MTDVTVRWDAQSKQLQDANGKVISVNQELRREVETTLDLAENIQLDHLLTALIAISKEEEFKKITGPRFAELAVLYNESSSSTGNRGAAFSSSVDCYSLTPDRRLEVLEHYSKPQLIEKKNKARAASNASL